MECILDYMRGGHHVSGTKMNYFAQLLGAVSEPNRIYGDHARRMEADRDKGHADEMRDILADWWNQELFKMTGQKALEKLVRIFEGPEIQWNSLAQDLRQLMTNDDSRNTAMASEADDGVPQSAKMKKPASAK